MYKLNISPSSSLPHILFPLWVRSSVFSQVLENINQVYSTKGFFSLRVCAMLGLVEWGVAQQESLEMLTFGFLGGRLVELVEILKCYFFFFLYCFFSYVQKWHNCYGFSGETTKSWQSWNLLRWSWGEYRLEFDCTVDAAIWNSDLEIF